jgi:hypothetical protein
MARGSFGCFLFLVQTRSVFFFVAGKYSVVKLKTI